MKKLHPVILGIRAVFVVTCLGALLHGISLTITTQELSGTYFVTAFTALISLLITHTPDFLSHKDTLMMPALLQVVFSIFTFCAMFLGEIMGFYDRFQWWDLMLHFTSGILCSLVGMSLFMSLNRDKQIRSQLNPAIIVMFAVCFSLACGVVWEIFEYAGDTLLGMNMQRWQAEMSGAEWSALQNTSNLSNPGLVNTMKDMIADALGSLASIALLVPLAKHGSKYKKTHVPTTTLLDEWREAYAMAATPHTAESAPVAMRATIRDKSAQADAA